MTRLSKPRLSDEQAAAQRLAQADVVTKAAMTAPLAGVLHKKKLSPTCIGRHNRTKDLWKKFLRQRAADPAIPQPETPFPTEIVPGVKLPGWDIVKEFVRYLGYTLQGKLDEYVVKATIRGYIFAFYALWARYAYLPVPKEHRLHIMSYFESPEFDATSKLSTKARAKPTADIVDVATLIMGILQDDKYVRLNRSRYNMTYVL
ncbi:hypothetical protein B0H16DRAFT_1815354 [Mycena metata]|uniref:Uncharacterized protein n=1 Tax=Mycena metata TaxID=1033252 RepID=A0AAD7J995_9AGAR|nr:hypothetical protein B0H16DRAFT_1815354 [Mycena metata]